MFIIVLLYRVQFQGCYYSSSNLAVFQQFSSSISAVFQQCSSSIPAGIVLEYCWNNDSPKTRLYINDSVLLYRVCFQGSHYSSSILAVFQQYSSNIPAVFQKYFSCKLALFQHHSSTIPALYQPYLSIIPVSFQYHSSSILVLFQHYFLKTAKILLEYCLNTAGQTSTSQKCENKISYLDK